MAYEDLPKKGTTTVGLLCSDGVILASEKRATMGNLIANKEIDKVLQIADHIGITIAGLVGDAQVIQRIMKAQIALYEVQRDRRISVQAAGTLLANILQENKYFPYWLQIILGGYDSSPRLYSLDMSGSLIEEKSVSTGSGSPVAYGVLEARYKEGKTVKENIPIAVEALSAAMERDAFSGNGINMAVIDSKGFRKLSDEEVKALLK
ncbi:proteasome endopeptidase complex, archaeal, beta subunit [Candidatus Micrarchaeota archaeon]|nr:MAG: proteasome endopeptidase complex, archaeal, beta subunit [Candidatus Micrarchaeota archaeon]